MSYKYRKYSPSIIFTTVTRLIFAPIIFVSPIIASIIQFVFDWADGEIFKRSGYKKRDYNIIDKLLDLYWYLFIVAYALLHRIDGLPTLIILFFIRLTGQILFMHYQKQIILFIFPNIFEIFFFFTLLTPSFPSLKSYCTSPEVLIILVIISPIVLIREFTLHIKQSNMSNFFTGKKTYWNK